MDKRTHDRRCSSASDRRKSYQPIQLNRLPAQEKPLPLMDSNSSAENKHPITFRENAILVREEAMIERENDLLRRENLLKLNQGKASARRIQEISDAQIAKATQEYRQSKLIEANENLKLASVQHQINEDQTESSKHALNHLANHDFLTNLPNHLQLYDRINFGIAFAKRHHQKLAVLILDLDRFKSINDKLGHAIGDQLLQAVAHRLSTAIRNSDTVSRQSGDEFVLMLSEVNLKATLARNVKKLHAVITAPYMIARNKLLIGATIGISIFPEDGKDTESLIRHADDAMQFAKANGRNRYQFFSEEIRDGTLN